MHGWIVTTAGQLRELCVAVMAAPKERRENCVLQTDGLCKLSLSRPRTEGRQDQVTGPAMLLCGLRELESKEGSSNCLGSCYTCWLAEPQESSESTVDSSVGSKGRGVQESLIPSVHPLTNPGQALLGRASPLCVGYSQLLSVSGCVKFRV